MRDGLMRQHLIDVGEHPLDRLERTEWGRILLTGWIVFTWDSGQKQLLYNTRARGPVEKFMRMFEDRWLTGWGAGSFRYGFTKYQRREQDLEYMAGDRVRWEHVHDDWLELLIEVGVIGALPVAAMLAFWVSKVATMRLWRRLAALPMLSGLVLLGIHAFVDFPFQNLAILATATALLPLLVRWGEIEREAGA